MMYELTGQLSGNITFTAKNNPIVTLELNEKLPALNMAEELKGEKLTVKIEKYSEKRSLNANAYAWCLIGKIGNAIREGKNEVYFRMLKQYGQSEMISVLSHIAIKDYVRYCEEAGESTLNGKKFTHYRVYKGSSEFDTKEMSIFIDGIVSEAKELGIQTDTPEQIARMKSLWGE